MENYEFLKEYWGEESALQVMQACKEAYSPMTVEDFLNHCRAMGGDWSGMFLTGILDLFPNVWDAIPEKMGEAAFSCLVNVLELCGVGAKGWG